MSSKNPIALVCSDLHLWNTPPAAREGEVNWIAAQEAALIWVNLKAEDYGVPVICAGDIFHKPRVHPSIEVLAARLLRGWYCIPGQHDLPNHRLDRIGESSYGVLVETETIVHISQQMNIGEDIRLWPFPWGAELTPCPKNSDINIAVIHKLVWEGKAPFPGADSSGNVKALRKALKGYDFIVAGDHHIGFVNDSKTPVVINCGSLMRRSADQEKYDPACYVLFADGSVSSCELPTNEDCFSRLHIEEQQERDERIQAFVNTLKNDVEIELSFESNLLRYCEANEISGEVKEMILEEMQ